MQEYLNYLKKFYLAILIVILAIAAVIILIKFTIPEFKAINDIQNSHKSQTINLTDAERKLADLNTSIKKEKEAEVHIAKAFFEPSNFDLDNEAAISEEFSEILQLLRDNKVKTYSLSFDPSPEDDKFVKNASDKYNVSRMNASMIASYTDFEGFLRDLYKHDHFLDISSIEIKPYYRNKKILIITFKLKLYAQKFASPKPKAPVQPAEPQPANPQPANPQPATQTQPNPVQPNTEKPKTNKSDKPNKKSDKAVKNDTPPVDESQYKGDEMTRKHKVYEDKVKK